MMLNVGADKKATVVHPAMAHKWRLHDWEVDEFDTLGVDYLTFNTVSIHVTESPSLFKAGRLHLSIEEDSWACVSKAIEARKGRVGTITVEVLDGNGEVIKTIEFHRVRIKHHCFDLSYAGPSSVLTANLECSYRKMVVH